MPLILLFGLVTCSTSFTKTASATPAKTVSRYYIDCYVVGGYLFNASDVVTCNQSHFPMLVETYQMGYGNTVFQLDGSALSSSEYSEYMREPIYDPVNPSSKVVVGWDIVWQVNPSSSKLYNGKQYAKV